MSIPLPGRAFPFRATSIILTLVLAVASLHATPPDSLVVRKIRPGVIHKTIYRSEGPWRIDIVEIDLNRSDLWIESGRAGNRMYGREGMGAIVARRTNADEKVIAAVNGDFFSLETGETMGNQIIEGTFVRASGPRRTLPPSQFGMTYDRHPFMERCTLNGVVIWNDGTTVDVSGVNTAPEGDAISIRNLYDRRKPWRSGRLGAIEEVPLEWAKSQGDTAVYVAKIGPRADGDTTIESRGVVLAGFSTEPMVLHGHRIAAGDTVKVVIDLFPHIGRTRTLVGGLPRIVVEGRSVAGLPEYQEGSSAEFASTRHPRSGVGFSKDSSSVYFITVDGRQAASVGMSLGEFANLMLSLGVYHGMNLDGGGSTTMIVEGRIVNSPSDPGGERPVGDCLLLMGNARVEKSN